MNNFLKGMGRAMDLFGIIGRKEIQERRNNRLTDAEAIASDWEKVINDMNIAAYSNGNLHAS